MYAQKLEGDSWRGEKLDSGKIDKMSGMLSLTRWLLQRTLELTATADQQLGQLYELMQAIQKGERERGDVDL